MSEIKDRAILKPRDSGISGTWGAVTGDESERMTPADHPGGRLGLAVFVLSAVLSLCRPATAAQEPDPARLSEVFPQATAFGVMEGTPPAVPVYRDGSLAGYVFSTRQVVASAGFSGKPLDILAGIDLDARITGATILDHREPILVIGVSDADLAAFVAQYRGLDVREPVRVARRGGTVPGEVDAVTGATISSVVFNDAILRAGRAVARSRGLLGEAQAHLDFDRYAPTSWESLRAEASLVTLSVTVGEARARFEERDAWLFPPAVAPAPETTFLEIYAGLATPARVGRNLLGQRLYNRLMAEIGPGDQLVFVAGRGLYSFKGTSYVRHGVFDRLQLVQGETTVRFTEEAHQRLEELQIEGAPSLRELAIFKVSAASGFAPDRDWRLEVLVEGEDASGAPVFATFALPYRLPDLYLNEGALPAENLAEPLWHQTWRERRVEIAALSLLLVVLTLILVFQDWVAQRKRLYDGLRVGFLVVTLVWLGWIAGAQLSVLNVLTFADAILTEFHWDFFLLEPLMFILWSYVAVALLFWGRGVFCGWLCPFGALQDLANRGAQRLGIPQWRLPFALHERLWPIKYIVFLALFAVFLGEPTLALLGAEVEPFKTAIILKFERAWPFVAYALGLLAASIFVNRAFCRYLCPLGGSLAIPARVRMFEWLRRRWQCGAPCQICAQSCPVQAIHPTGQINPNECIHCLHCQVNYYDEYVCPPLVDRRKRREHRMAARAAHASQREAAEEAGP
ncbi:MAG TPA: 4Fe-4S binding protein [Kiloniellales bacterium]|nr:4Fe-4S binding protein [Kiloniellales bacterium]